MRGVTGGEEAPSPPVDLTLPTGGAIRRAYVDCDIGQLHLRYLVPAPERRRGRPVALFAAAPSSGVVFRELMLDLGQDRTVLAFDSPGCGASDAPDTPFEHPRLSAGLFAQALRRLGVETADLYGNHSGAVLALALAAFYPGQVGAVAVSAVPFIRDEARREALRGRYISLEDIAALEALRLQHERKVTARPASLGFERAVELYTDALAAGVRMNWPMRASYAPGHEDWLATIAAPVTYLQTNNTLREATIDAASVTPLAHLRERGDLDHFALWTRAAELAAELRRAFAES